MTQPLKVVTPEAAVAFHWLTGKGLYFAQAADTGGAFSAWEDAPPPGHGPLSHAHTLEEELFYVLEGQLTFETAGQAFVAEAGAVAALPKGLGHRFRNTGQAISRALLVNVPAGSEGFFLTLGNPYSEPHDATAPPDPKRFRELGAEYGQHQAVPSLLHPDPKPEPLDLPLGFGRSPVFREPGAGEAFTTGDVLLTLKVVGPQTLDTYSLTEIKLAPRATFPAHRHARYTEGLLVLDGEVSLSAGGTPVVARAGSLVVVPPGAVHALANPSDNPARLLSVCVGAGVENLYRAACRPVYRTAEWQLAGADSGRLAELGPRFGVEFV